MSKRILVIDDDHLVVRTIGKLLENEGYLVITAESGKEALSTIENEEVDLIISDIRMPGMDGVETALVMDKYFKNKTKKPPPLIFITGYAEEKTNKMAQDLEPSDFLYKPFNKDDFLKAIGSALGG